MTKPAMPALAEGGVHSGETSMSQHFFVDNLMLPPNSKNTVEILLVEGVNFIILYILQCPCFAEVHKSTANTGTIDSRLYVDN